MRSPISIAGVIGLTASVAAISLWTAEQLSGQMAFELATIPFKLALLVVPLFFLSDLSAFLYRRPRIAVALGLTLVAVTSSAMLAYLPWRDAFARHFSNSVYRWYYSNMPSQHPGLYGDFDEWQMQWAHHVPHAIEAGLLSFYYATVIIACTIWRLRRAAGAIVAVVGYLLLFLVPIFTGLIVWDYDTFLKGIAFDSISMDLFPLFFWQAGDYSIFLYAFMFIFFGVTATFFYLKPRVSADSHHTVIVGDDVRRLHSS